MGNAQVLNNISKEKIMYNCNASRILYHNIEK